MNLVLLFVSYSLLPCTFLFVLTNTQSQIGLISCDYHIQKTWVLNFCLFHSSRPSTAQAKRTDRVNTHAGEYSTPVKCACEDMVSPRSTLRRVYTTPRGVTPAFVLVLLFDCGSFEESKNKASVTPFNM